MGAPGDQSATRKYTTDGTPTTFGLSFNDKMSLSPDGKSLTSAVRISSPQGDVEITVVFDREKQARSIPRGAAVAEASMRHQC